MRKKMLISAVVVAVLFAIVTSITLLLSGDEQEEMMQEAYELRKVQQYSQAASLFGKIAVMYPHSPQATTALFEEGITYFDFLYPVLNDSEKPITLMLAQQAFERLVDRYPESDYVLESLKKLAKISDFRGMVASSIKHRLAILEYANLTPEEKQVVFSEIAAAYESRGGREQATRFYNEVVTLNISGSLLEDAVLKLVDYQLENTYEDHKDYSQQYREVIKLLTNLVNNHPISSNEVNHSTHMYLVDCFLKLHKFEAAEQILMSWQQLPKTQYSDEALNYREDQLRTKRAGQE